jgi:hypothetical protein
MEPLVGSDNRLELPKSHLTEGREAMTHHTIRVEVSGGMVQHIRNIPPNTRILVYDYDNDDEVDEDGHSCSIDEYLPKGEKKL